MAKRRRGSIGSSRIDAGARNIRIAIQRLTQTVGASRIPVEDWTALSAITLDASREEMSGEERFSGGQMSTPFVTLWGIEYRADMDPDLVNVPKERRVVYAGRSHDIVAARVLGYKEGIELSTLARRG